MTLTCRVALSPRVPARESNVAGKFEVYEDRAGKFRFRLKAGNGEVVASGEAHESQGGVRAGGEAVQPGGRPGLDRGPRHLVSTRGRARAQRPPMPGGQRQPQELGG